MKNFAYMFGLRMRKLAICFGLLLALSTAAHGDNSLDVDLVLSFTGDEGGVEFRLGDLIITNTPSYGVQYVTNRVKIKIGEPIPGYCAAFGDAADLSMTVYLYKIPSCCSVLINNSADGVQINTFDNIIYHAVFSFDVMDAPESTNFTLTITQSSAPEVRLDTCQGDGGVYYLAADGLSTTRAFLAGSNVWTSVAWSISSQDNLGCSIDSSTGLIRAGTRAGHIRVRATNTEQGVNGCFVEQDLELSECSACDLLAAILAMLQSVDVSISLGRANNGQSMGRLTIYSPVMTNWLYTPASLQYNYNRDLQVMRKADGMLRQLLSTDALVNIFTNSDSEYFIDFYPASAVSGTNFEDGIRLYTPTTNACLRRIKVGNPDASATNRLSITDYDPVHSAINNLYIYAVTNGVWSLTTGTNGVRQETKSSSWSGTNVETITRQISDASGTVAVTGQKFTNNALGRFLIEQSWGSGSDLLTDTYVYNEAGDCEQFDRHDGYKERRQFDSQHRLTKLFASFKNTDPNTNNLYTSRLFEFQYSIDGVDDGSYQSSTPRVIIEKLSSEIRRRYAIVKEGERVDILCPNPGLSISNSANLFITNWFYTSGPFKDELKETDYADGTIAFYEYSLANGLRINTVTAGQPGSARTNIVDGILATTVLGSAGQVLTNSVFDIATGYLLDRVIYLNFDDYARPQTVLYLDGTSNTITYACCGPATVTGRDGVVTSYEYDALKRPLTTTLNGIKTFNTWDAAGNLLQLLRRGTNNNDITAFSAIYDVAGRMRTNWNALSQPTIITESGVPPLRTVSLADGGVRQELYYRDGTLATNLGSATFPARYDKGYVSDDGDITREFRQEIKLDASGNNTSETTTYLYDGLGRVHQILYSASGNSRYARFFYNTKGQLERTVDPDGVTTLYLYNDRGELEIKAVKRINGTTIDWSHDAIVQVTREVATNAQGKVVLRYKKYAWLTENNSTGTQVAQAEITADGLQSVVTVMNTNDSRTVTTTVSITPSTKTRTVVQQGSDGSAATNTYVNGRLISSYRYAGSACIGGETYAYDPHGRLFTVTDYRTGTVTTNGYNEADWLNQLDIKASGINVQTSAFEYDPRGRLQKTTLPDSLKVTNVYSLSGLLRTNIGARTYPAEFGYDAQGRMTGLTTWTNTSAGSGASTAWGYDAYSGFLSSKTYAGSVAGPSFTFTPAGRSKTRVSARSITTTYSTNVAGQVSGITYSDTNMAAVAFDYDRMGRLKTVTTNSVTANARTYNNLGQLTSETQGDVTVSYTYSSLLQMTNLTVTHGGTNLAVAGYQYDSASRLVETRFGVFSVTNTFSSYSSLPLLYSFRQGTTNRLLVFRFHDNLDRLYRNYSIPSAGSTFNFQATFNPINQRTNIVVSDGSKWQYQYDYLGQLTNAVHRWSDNTLVAGQQFSYSFDEIGNRRTATRDTRQAVYSPNALNQATGRDNSGYVNILGSAGSTVTVTVNAVSNYPPVERKGEYFRKELLVTNTSGPVWFTVTNIAVLNQLTNDIINTNIGHVYVPSASETLYYDADGNLTNDGRFAYTWDAENRLLAIETLAIAYNAGAPRQRLEFAYDWMDRRTRKAVYDWQSDHWSLASDLRFVYDGWNLVAILDAPSSALLASFTWGNDLSGTRQGAGGIGGLLAMNIPSGTNAGTYFYCYNDNGSVVGLVNAANGQVAAVYEHGAFGELLRATGPLAFFNPFRFSTKYQDDETGLLYYGRRYYSPDLCRWLSRDPISENGGVNLYGFVGNNPINIMDPYGLQSGIGAGYGTMPLPHFPKADEPSLGDTASKVGSSWLDNLFNTILSIIGMTMRDPAGDLRQQQIMDRMVNNAQCQLGSPLARNGFYQKGSQEDYVGTGVFLLTPLPFAKARPLPINDLVIVTLENDTVVLNSANAIALVRGDVVGNIGILRSVQSQDILTLVGHGDASGVMVSGLTGEEIAFLLDKAGVKSLGISEIELVACHARPCAISIANKLRIPVRSVKSTSMTVNVLEDVVGVPQVRVDGILQTPGIGWKLNEPMSDIREAVYKLFGF